jgi:hypothetical protein
MNANHRMMQANRNLDMQITNLRNSLHHSHKKGRL